MISIGIYAVVIIFLYIIIPGFVVRRFFYHGEFSKQINHSTSYLVHLVYSSFIGIIFLLFFIFTVNCFKANDVDLDGFLSGFNKYSLSEDTNTVHFSFKGLTQNLYKEYIPFIFTLYIFCATISFFSSKIMLFLGLDTRFKFLRFKNNWHYIFSGKFFKFKKHSEHNLENNFKVKYTFVDVLVSGESEKPVLYSGLLADYDLCHEDINKLERIHLLKATRYKTEGNVTVIKNIPGNLFTIIGDKILNINCTYAVFNQNEINYKWYRYKKNILIPLQILNVLIFICAFIFLIFELFESTLFEHIFKKNIWFKLFLLFDINIILGLITPFTINFKDKEIKFIGWKAIRFKFLLIFILSSILYYYY